MPNYLVKVFDPKIDNIYAASVNGLSVKDLAIREHADVAINFSYADTVKGVPIGRLVIDSKTIVFDIDKTAPRDELYMLPDKSLHIGKHPAPAWAIQGTPPLLKDGKDVIAEGVKRDRTLADVANRPATRTASGITAAGKLVIVRTTDAVTLQELKDIMLKHGCVDALNGDGGGSSYMYPIDNGWGRKLGAALIVKEGVKPVVNYEIDHIPKDTPCNRRPGHLLQASTLTIHNTGNPTSTASGERRNLTNPTNTRTASFHIVIDEHGAIECLPLNENAWHSTDGNTPTSGNRTSIGIELCESGDYKKTLENAVELVASMLKQRGWGVDRLRRHFDWMGKICPHLMYDEGKWTGWVEFKKRVAEKLATPKEVKPLETKVIPVNVVINGKDIADGHIINGVTYAPVRALAEEFGAKIAWNQTTKTVTVTK